MLKCVQARDFLLHPDGADIPHLMDHLVICPTCQRFFSANEPAFERLLAQDPLGALSDLAVEAFRRLERGGGSRSGGLDAPPWPVVKIPGYALGEQIGQTRSSRVFVATQVSLDRPVALKVVQIQDGWQNHQFVAREAAVLAALKHPNILTIHETGIWQQGIWLALEYCPEGSLAGMLDLAGPWEPMKATMLIRKIAMAAHCAHELGIVHRDIKPANILIGSNDEPKLADFGYAENSSPDLGFETPLDVVGTPAYMSPEQAQSRPLDRRSDVHALGAVLYHLLTGRAPFRACNNFEAMMLAAHTMPAHPCLVYPALSRDLGEICMKCLAKDPYGRYGTAKELALDLERFLNGKEVRAYPLSSQEQAWRWVRRNKMVAGAIVAALTLLVVSVFGFAILSLWAMHERHLAQENENRALEQQSAAGSMAYLNKVQRAHFEWEYGSPRVAVDLLESCAFQYRGWEHDFVTTRTRQNQVTLQGHAKDVNGVAIAPDGKSFVSASDDGTARLWDLTTGEEKGTLLDTGGIPLRGAVYSADGSVLAVAGKNRLVHLRAINKQQEVVSTVQTAFVASVNSSGFGETIALTPDGATLLCEVEHQGIGAWDTHTGLALRQFPDWPQGVVRSVAVNPAGTWVAAGGGDGHVVVWEVATGRKIWTIRINEAAVRCLCFSADGLILFAGSDSNFIQALGAGDGKLLREFRGHQDSVASVAVSADGKLLASGSDDNLIKIWECASGALLETLIGHSDTVRCVRFASSGHRLVSCGWDDTIKVWNPRASQQARLPHPGSVIRCLNFSPDGKLLATGAHDRLVRVWDSHSGRLLHALAGHNDRVQALAFHPGGELLATCSSRPDTTLRIWDPVAGTQKSIFESEGPTVSKICYSPDGKYIYGACDGGRILVIDARSGAIVRSFQAHEEASIGLAISPDGRWLASGGDDRLIHLWDTTDWSLAQSLRGHESPVLCLAFNSDGSCLASGGEDARLVVWDWRHARKVTTIRGHTGGITSVQFSPDRRCLLSSSFDKTVRIWNPLNGDEFITLPSHLTASRCASFSPDGKRVASGSDEGAIHIHEASSQMESFRIRGGQSPFTQAGFLSSADLIVTANEVEELSFWDPGTGREVAAPALMEDAMPDSEDGKWIVERRGQDVVLVDKKLRNTRKAEDRNRLREWAARKD